MIRYLATSMMRSWHKWKKNLSRLPGVTQLRVKMMVFRIFYWLSATRKRTSYHRKKSLKNERSTMKDQLREMPLCTSGTQKHPQEDRSRINQYPEMETITRLRHIYKLTNYTEQPRLLRISHWKANALIL